MPSRSAGLRFATFRLLRWLLGVLSTFVGMHDANDSVNFLPNASL
jgi:hypothetical protein